MSVLKLQIQDETFKEKQAWENEKKSKKAKQPNNYFWKTKLNNLFLEFLN